MGTFNEAEGTRKFTSEKHRRVALAKDLFIASLIKEDKDLRADAKCLDCLEELVERRELVLDFTKRQTDFQR